MRTICWRVLAVLCSVIAGGVATDAMAQGGPPVRVFGTVQVEGATPPPGTRVEALIEGKLCGEGVVREIGGEIGTGYVVDVRPESLETGCGVDGQTIRLKVGGQDAPQTAEFASGSFIRLDLSLSGRVETPTSGPTPPPFGAAAQPTATPAPTASPAPGPATSPSPTGTGTATATSPTPASTSSATTTATATPSATATPTATSEATPSATASATPTGTPGIGPATGAEPVSDEDGTAPVVWVLLGLAVLAAAGVGAYVFRRNRAQIPPPPDS